jgi:flavin reductase (DIM6/NTAB) family NADH-FMN oxidoreductase RutF
MNHQAVADMLARTDRELWLVTARANERRGGLIATFFSSASLPAELPRVLIAVAKQHHTWQLIEASRAFGLHTIARRHLEWVWRFGLQSGRDFDKLDGLTIETAITGMPLLSDACGWLDCRVEATLDTGDRTAYLAEVVEARCKTDEPPLTTKTLLEIAPPERLAQLREQMRRDSEIDAAAIQQWRAGVVKDEG